MVEIREGTALARLVAETHTHGPEMALAAAAPSIKLDIPPWLAAHYRRNHSEMPKVAMHLDPTGGYPLVLENLHAWMLLHQDLLPPPAPAFKAATAPSAGANLKISGDHDNPHSESDIRINPNDPNQIIAASNNIGNSRQAQYFSLDGGVTWGQTTLPLLNSDSLHSDATVDWTSDGTAWATTIGISADSTVLQMRAYKSSDAGRTWVFDGTFSGNQTSADKQMMWVDRSPTSPFRDRIYVIWHNNNPAFVSFRNSSGWHAPLQVSHAETTGTAIGSDITTDAAGTVFAVWPDTGTRSIFFAKSTDGGVTFGTPRLVAKTFATFQITLPAIAKRAALVGASIAAFNNNVYVSWVDLSGENGCNSPNNEPGVNVNSNCTSRIWFARSADGGQTFSQPIKVNPTADKSDQFNHKLAVDPETGVLGLGYYGTGTGANRIKTDFMFQCSSDGGQTWSTPVTKVTTASTDETTVDADRGNQYGDYNGLSVAKGIFFPCWTDRRDDGAEAIFTARITLRQNAQGVLEPNVAAAAGA